MQSSSPKKIIVLISNFIVLKINLRLIIKEKGTPVVNLPLSKDEWGLEPIYEGLDINHTARYLIFMTDCFRVGS